MKCNAPIDLNTGVVVAKEDMPTLRMQGRLSFCTCELNRDDEFCPSCGAPVRSETSSDSQDCAVVSEEDDDGGFFSFNGRARRAEYWKVYFLVAGIDTVLLLLLFFGYGPNLRGESLVYVFLISYLVSFAMLPVSVRRCHDIGNSGWWCAIFWIGELIPYLNVPVCLIFTLVLGSIKGNDGPNKFGLAARSQRRTTIVVRSDVVKPPAESRLKKLEELLSAGVISEEEYQRQRQKIISEI